MLYIIRSNCICAYVRHTSDAQAAQSQRVLYYVMSNMDMSAWMKSPSFRRENCALLCKTNNWIHCLLIKYPMNLFVRLYVIRHLSVALHKVGSPSVSSICSVSLFLSHVLRLRHPTERKTVKSFHFEPTLPTSVWLNKISHKTLQFFFLPITFLFFF